MVVHSKLLEAIFNTRTVEGGRAGNHGKGTGEKLRNNLSIDLMKVLLCLAASYASECLDDMPNYCSCFRSELNDPNVREPKFRSCFPKDPQELGLIIHFVSYSI